MNNKIKYKVYETEEIELDLDDTIAELEKDLVIWDRPRVYNEDGSFEIPSVTMPIWNYQRDIKHLLTVCKLLKDKDQKLQSM